MILGAIPAFADVDFQEVKRLAEQGDAKAQYNLALMYGKGEGVTQDYYEAVRWYRKATQQGHVNAQDLLKELGETW
ncbi:MAG: sel1 repeat family protein [Synergistaceae bacterium]|nr:sel1 repeat family protein [Synergistaceae bacterium]